MKRLSLSAMLTRLLLVSLIAAMPVAAVSFCLLWSPARGLTTAVFELLLLTLLSVVSAAVFGHLFVMRSLHDDLVFLKRSDSALRDSEERLRGVVDMAVDGIITIDERGIIETVNPAVARVFGYDPAEMIGQNVGILMPEPFQSEHDTYLSNGPHDGERKIIGSTREVAGLRKDGTAFPADLAISEFRLGKRRMFTGVVRDITARKAAERQLRENHSLLRALIEGITDPIYVKDALGRYLMVNRALADSVGRAPEEVIGADDEQVFGAGTASLRQDYARRVVESGFPQTYEETVAAQDYVRHYLTTAAPYHGADGRVVGLLGISRDITSQKKIEQAARESEKHLRQVLDSLLVFIVVMTPDGVVTGMNQALRREVENRGNRVEELMGKVMPDVLWWAAAPDARDSLRAAMGRAAQGETVRLDAVHLKSSHKAFVLDAMIAPMSDATGNVTHLILSTIDITERKRAEERAREQQAELYHLERARTMGQMASGLAHELRQPLGAIVNYAGASRTLLASGRIDPTRVAETLGMIADEATRAGEIIRRLRSMVKKHQPEGRPANTHDLVTEAVSLLSYDLRQAGIQPTLDLAEGLPEVWADTVQIHQVLVNLVHNAIDALESRDAPSRSLVLSTRTNDDGAVRVDVADNGCGVPPENVESIFNSFFTTKPEGLGMGLALCRTIIEDHGGHLNAASNPTGGMTFSFTLKSA